MQIELNEKEIEILKLLNIAPRGHKTIHFCCAKLDQAFNTIYHKVMILVEKEAIFKHKTPTGNVFYIPVPEVMEEIKNTKKKK